jgi:ABC-type glycerol-3-phosphate transport system permease component
MTSALSRRAFLSLMPLLVVFLAFQRTFVQGIASTGLE